MYLVNVIQHNKLLINFQVTIPKMNKQLVLQKTCIFELRLKDLNWYERL